MKTKNISMLAIVIVIAIATTTVSEGALFGRRPVEKTDKKTAAAIATNVPPSEYALTNTAPPTPATPTSTGVLQVPPQTAAKTINVQAQKPVQVQFSTNGMAGGVECLFQSTRSKTVTVTVAIEGYKYTFDILPADEEVIDLLPGSYSYTYTVEGDSAIYPTVGTLSFTVTKSPTHGFKGKKAYCGGLRFSE